MKDTKNELKPRIHDEKTGIDYVLVGDYYLPEIAVPQENRPIGKWGSLHRAYLKEHRPAVYASLCLTGRLHTYLADLNEQAQGRFQFIMRQMMKAEGVTEDLKRADQMLWIRSVNSIISRAEEIIRQELIYC